MVKRKLWLIAYDVGDTKRLSKALKIVTDYSCGGQKSCHEAWLSNSEVEELKSRLGKHLNPEEDKWALFPIGFQPKLLIGGIARKTADHKSIFIGW